MTARAHHRPLVAHLRGWTAEQVAGLLRRRPDLAQPEPPADIAELAQRAQYRPSIDAAVGASTLPENRLLQVVVCCRPDVPLDELAATLPEGVGLDDVAGPLSSLEAAALVWRHGGRLHCSDTLRQGMPTTLGPPLQALAGAHTVDYLKAVLVRLRSEIADAGFPGAVPPRAIGPDGRPPRKAELIEELASLLASPGVVISVLAGSPEGAAIAVGMADGRPLVPVDHSLYYSGYSTSGYYRRFPTYWLFERALLLPVGDGRTAAQPREVGVALRGGRPVHDLALDPPVLATGPAQAGEVDARAAVRGVRTLDRLADLLDRWEQAPAKALKNGGLGAMVMKQTAAALETDAEETTRLVELAHLAGLVNSTTVTTKERRTYVHQAYVGPTPQARAWGAHPVPERWQQLATAWLRAEHWPSASGRKGPEVKAVPVMSVQYAAAGAPDLRRRVLDTLASLEPSAATTSSTLAAYVYWERPQPWLGLDLGLGAEDPATVIGWVYAEAELLGVVADGSLSSFGRAVLAGKRRPAEEALVAAMPEPATTFVLQADLTATVVGALDRSVLSELRLLADVESTGAATTLRFSDASLRRALDAGRDGDAIMAFLSNHATKGVPKPLAYLVGDVVRRYGHLQVGTAGSFVTSDDPAVLADACSHRRTRKLALRLLAPTVAVSPHPSAKVLSGLREAGFLPTAEGADGEASPGEGADHRARAAHAASIAIHEAFNPARSRGADGGDAAGTSGPDAVAKLPEPYRARTRSRERPAPAIDGRRAAALAEAILARRPDDIASGQPPGTDQISAPRRNGPGEAPSRQPTGSVPLPMAFPHDPADEDDDGFFVAGDLTWADPAFWDGSQSEVEDDTEIPEHIEELLKWAFEHRRVLGIRVADGEDLSEPILFAVTGWRPDLLSGTDLADGAAVTIMPQDIGAVTDLGPVDELDNVAMLGDTQSRPHRRRSSRGRRR